MGLAVVKGVWLHWAETIFFFLLSLCASFGCISGCIFRCLADWLAYAYMGVCSVRPIPWTTRSAACKNGRFQWSNYTVHKVASFWKRYTVHALRVWEPMSILNIFFSQQLSPLKFIMHVIRLFSNLQHSSYCHFWSVCYEQFWGDRNNDNVIFWSTAWSYLALILFSSIIERKDESQENATVVLLAFS